MYLFVFSLLSHSSLGVMLHGHSHDGIPQTLCWPTDCAIKPEGHSSHEAINDNFNIRAAFLHVIGDIIQSMGVCIAAVIIYIEVCTR